MNINVLVMGILALILSGYAWKAYMTPVDAPAPNFLPFVPIDVRKTKVYVSPTKDASMYTERTRRTAIIGNPQGVYSYKGSTNGSLEWNFLTSVCVCPPRNQKVCPAPEYIADAGNATSDVCDILDGSGTEVLDFGDSGANVCD
jgi:hypothetical protein